MTIKTNIQAVAYAAKTPYVDVAKIKFNALLDQWMAMMNLNEGPSVIDILEQELAELDEKGFHPMAQANTAVILDHLQQLQRQYGEHLLYVLDDIYSYIYQDGDVKPLTIDDLNNIHPLKWDELVSAVDYMAVTE